MISVALIVLLSVFNGISSEAPRGFYPIAVNASRSENRTERYQDQPEYFVLTGDGRLQKIQLVFPDGVKPVQTEEREEVLLTPDGRLEKLQEEKPAEYFKLTQDGKLRRVEKDEVPQEENGEYHIVLPNGSLQRVRYMTVSQANKLTSNVNYQEVEPIRGSVYSYSAPLVKVLN